MKATQGLVMIAFLGMVSCFNPPEYPVVPNIEFDNISFVEGTDTDSLILSLRFKDGDGDIGLSDADDQLNEFTKIYAERFYFTQSGQRYVIQDIVQLRDSPRKEESDLFKSLLKFNNRKKSPFDSLPGFVRPYSCLNWDILKKTLSNNVEINTDTVYFQLNPDHYNIFIKFMIKQADGSWKEYNIREEFCTTIGYDGRIPVLAKDDGETPLQGTIRYAMQSVAFKQTFSIKTLKLRVKIQDRALNKSNEIETKEFTLSDITRK
jgi:hypothetical protein